MTQTTAPPTAAAADNTNHEGVCTVNSKKIIVDRSEWVIADADVETVRTQIRTAMSEGGVAELALFDGDKRPVTVYLNGKTVGTVVVDLDTDSNPRPSELSG
jgi:hypothetical protein